MSERRTIGNTFTVNTVEDGESAPYYFQEWFAWSNDSTTASVTTAPAIAGSWATSIPAQGSYAYLWRKSIRYVWNENTRQYSAETAQYFRMSGTNGTSIKTKGTIKVAITASGTFPTSGFSNGDLGVKQGDSYIWKFNGSSWSHVSSASSDGDSYTMTKDCTIDLEGDGTSENIKGHLIQWSTEASKWIDLGQFKGESGVTYYTHIAWATNVTISEGSVISVEGFTTVKSPNDTTHLWMGVLVDESSGADPSKAASYTWSYTKGNEGEKGDDAIVYEIQSDLDTIKVPSGQTSFNTTINLLFFSKAGNATKQAFSTHYSTFIRRADGHLFRTATSRNPNTGLSPLVSLLSTDLAYIVYIWGQTRYTGDDPESQTYLAKQEIPILKDGADGQDGARGKVGRFYYFVGTFNAEDETTHFIVNDSQVPYFEHTETVTTQSGTTTIKRYHVFNPETTPESGSMTMAQMWAASDQSWNNAPWEVMTNDFKYLITEALFGKYANLGSFLINEDWLMSNLGSVAGNTNPTISYKEWENSNWVNVQAPAYTFFDATELKEDKTGVWAITERWEEGEKETFNLLDGLYYFKCTVKNCLIALVDEYNYSYILVDTTSGGQVASSFFLKLPHSGNYTLNMYEYSVGDGAEVIAAGGFYKAQFVPYIAINGSDGQIYHSGDNGSFYANWLDMVKGNIGMFRVLNDWSESSLVSSKDISRTNPDNFAQLTEDGQLVLIHKNSHSSTQVGTPEALHVEGNVYFGSLSNIKIGNYSFSVDSNGFLKAQQS